MKRKLDDTNTVQTDRPTSFDAALAIYRQRHDHFSAEEHRLTTTYNRLANTRLAIFVLLLIATWKGVFQGHALSTPWVVVSVITLSVFLATCWLHRRIAENRDRVSALAQINFAAEARLDRRWSDVPGPNMDKTMTTLPLVRDLDLAGDASLLHLLGSIATPSGRSILGDRLVTSSDQVTISRRQDAIRELTPDLDFRQEFQVMARKLALKSPNIQPFIDWVMQPAWLMNKRWLVHVIRSLTITSLTTIVLTLIGIIPITALLIVFVINLLLSAFFRTKVHRILSVVDHTKQDFFDYGNLFKLVSQCYHSSEELVYIRQEMSVDGTHAAQHMRRLHRIMEQADLRFSPMLHSIVQALTLWDFHVLSSLEKWRKKNGKTLPQWFSAMGEFEVLMTLANLAWDNPDWSYPIVRQMPEPVLTAIDIGHPLLHPRACVRNDVTIGPPASFLLVTGSNMSGKSTLLRAIGVNICLAQTGAPVCAREFTLPPVVLGTCFRIQDSLSSGTSFFLAEIQRIKNIIDLLDPTRNLPNSSLLYLFDELLLGTNIFERQIAVKRILHHLLENKAIGALATHDLTIAEDDLLKESVRPVHFHESFCEGHEQANTPVFMTFDYRLKPGLATTTNALKLLQLVGLIDDPHQS